MSKPQTVFISYKWEDDAHNEWVKKLATDLRRAGIEAILDQWEVRLGDSFTDYMTSRISKADVFLFIMTTKSVEAVENASRHGGAVKFEMQMATARRTAGEAMRLIPIYREGKKAAAHVRDHRYLDFRDDSRYAMNIRSLVNDLLGISVAPPVVRRTSQTAPPSDIQPRPRTQDGRSRLFFNNGWDGFDTKTDADVLFYLSLSEPRTYVYHIELLREYKPEVFQASERGLRADPRSLSMPYRADAFLSVCFGATDKREQSPEDYRRFYKMYGPGLPKGVRMNLAAGNSEAMWVWTLKVSRKWLLDHPPFITQLGKAAISESVDKWIAIHNHEIQRIAQL